MAETTQGFNLLYKVEAQKTFVDKLYDFLIGPARLIIVGVLIVIIGVFGYRFFLDTTLRTEKKKTDEFQRQIDAIVVPNEAEVRSRLARIDSYSIYQGMFRTPPTAGALNDPQDKGKLHYLAEAIKLVYSIKDSKYSSTVSIAQLSVINDPADTTIKIVGTSSTFAVVEQYVTDLKSASIIQSASSINIGASRNQLPQYQIDIKLVN